MRSSPDAPAPEASVLACRSCGSPLPITLAQGSIRCGVCGADTPIDPAYRASLRASLGDLAVVARRELEARFEAAFYEQNEKAARPIVAGAVGLANALAGMFVAWAITRQFGMGIPVVYFAPLVAVWALSWLAFARGWHVLFAIPDVSEVARVALVRCGRCGAVQVASSAPCTCGHCRSDLLVPCELAASLLASSRAASQRAVVDAAEGLARARHAGDRLVGVSVATVVVVTFGSIGLVLAVGRGPGPDLPSPTAWLVFLGVFVLALASMVASTLHGRRQRARLDAAIQATLRRLEPHLV